MKLKDFLSETANMVAMWITPKGKILDCGSLHHIDFIVKNPEKFGITREILKDFPRYGEVPETGKEGIIFFQDGIKDGDKLISMIIKNKFIRLRKVRATKYGYIWFVDVDRYDQRAKKMLSNWAYDILDKTNGDTQVMISVQEGTAPKGLTLNILANLSESHEPLEVISLDSMEIYSV